MTTELLVLAVCGLAFGLYRTRRGLRDAQSQLETLRKQVGAAWKVIDRLGDNLEPSGERAARPAAPVTAPAPTVAGDAARAQNAHVGEESGPGPEPTVEAPGASAPTDAAEGEGAEPRRGAYEPIPPSTGVGRRPPPVPRTPRPVTPAPEPRKSIEWEQLLGVKGAAVVGGITLVISLILLVRYSIPLISPTTRVAIGFLVGIAAILGSERLRGPRLDAAANALAGAGSAGLYAASWAAFRLYDLCPMGVSFGVMVLVTMVCGLLAVRRTSILIAVLGLLGGFATPIALSTGSGNPGVFGYLLLLNLGLIYVAAKQRWPYIGLAGVLLTALIQGAWLFEHFTAERFGLSLGIFGGFALFYAIASRAVPEEDRGTWLPVQVIGVAAPALFAFYFASRSDLDLPLVPLGIYLAILGAAAAWIARVHPATGAARGLALGIALGSSAVIGVWMAGGYPATSLVSLAGVLVGLTAVHHVVAELDPGEHRWRAPALGAALLGLAALVLLGFAGVGPGGHDTLWVPAAALVIAALLARQARLPRGTRLHLPAALGLAFALGVRFLGVGTRPPVLEVGVLLAAAVATQLFAVLARRTDRDPVWAEAGALVLPVLGPPLVVVVALAASFADEMLPVLGAPAALGLLGLLVAARARRGSWTLPLALSTAAAQFLWVAFQVRDDLPGSSVAAILALLGGTLALFAAWPFLVRPALDSSRPAWVCSALAPYAWFPSLYAWVDILWGDDFIGLLPVGLAAVGVMQATRSRSVFAAEPSRRLSALVWFLGAALGFVSLAVPLQFDREVITVAWALEGLALIALYRRLDHPGLKWVAATLLGVVTVRLVANPALLTYHARSTTPVLNWLLYTYGIPAVSLILGASWLAPLELARRRPWEEPLYRGRRPWLTGVLGCAGIVVVFAWINVTISDAFGTGPRLTLLALPRDPGRELTRSIAWAAYALVLLGVGMRKGLVPLRWLSLAFLILTLGKVFLFDLDQLEGLYRVLSVAGLAFSLILVSLLYQRFVFRAGGDSPEPPPEGEPPAVGDPAVEESGTEEPVAEGTGAPVAEATPPDASTSPGSPGEDPGPGGPDDPEP